MSGIASPEQLVQSNAQPPLSWHFDPRVLEVEQRVLFEQGPNYVGHELLVPNVGDYHVLDGEAQVLARGAGGVELLSNVCRHRQAVMLTGRGNAKHIVCPLHRWTYKLDGELLGAPHFPQNPCLNLTRSPLQNWNGMLFSGARDVVKDLGSIGVMKDLDFSGYMLDRIEIDEYAFNWKTFIEVYLEDYHVVPFHPGLGNFVDCDALKWEFGEHYSVQTVGIKNALKKAGSPIYGKWQEQVLRYYGDNLPEYGAIWLTYYPNIMVEWYPGTLVVSSIIPRGPEACANIIEFYYLEDIALFEREYVEAQQKAYRETAVEDDVICLRMHQGRRSLYQRGIEQQGPYQSPTEDGMLHFHEFLRRHLDPHLSK
ncbi:MAG: aromatic ring-hydroxylating dioxygenase subunit alpha [Gallionellaceae bacterium]|jgi:phenylpropionate dioxygenase-like ring-hydroxylating dioxygenase large terminal subunit|nr:aromatic ring-hydroxylating dioxygenase subunit alpha [Gallionellaceae bacterium]